MERLRILLAERPFTYKKWAEKNLREYGKVEAFWTLLGPKKGLNEDISLVLPLST